MSLPRPKYIFITGGVVSSLGKGIVGASLGLLLKSQGLRVCIQKFDPYLNLDPGTMSPYQHGEVFVTEDGCETDLDLGHYERFINQNLCRDNNVTSGMVYWRVLNKERNGDYLGNTVQIIPHVTNEIKDCITQVNQGDDTSNFDIVITEIGGTIGDIESLPFVEAIRQFQFQNKGDCIHIHLTLVPYLKTSGEFKTKPTQHSVKELRSIGIQPDLIVCRSLVKISPDIKRKIAMFCDVDVDSVISAHDVASIYDVPLIVHNEKMTDVACKKLGIEQKEVDLSNWKKFVQTLHDPTLSQVTIAIVGKYTDLSDAYLSVVESLTHASVENHCKIDIRWIESEHLDIDRLDESLSDVAGILIPGGFGERGIEGKIAAAQYARENNIPYFGLCLGMHIAAIEFARNVLGIKGAHSQECDPKTKDPIIYLMSDQKSVKNKGGTMRLGAYECHAKKGTLLYDAYESTKFFERHRHRYEFNEKYKDDFEKNGMIISGQSPDKRLAEVIEYKPHPWYLAVQFHPEFKSRPANAHPLFRSFVAAAKAKSGIQDPLIQIESDKD